MGSRGNRVSRWFSRRGVAMVALLAAALTVLLVAPASSASAGRYTTGIKVHNQTKEMTLDLVSGGVDNGLPYAPQWEAGKGPWDTPVIKPHHSGHYELLTQSDFRITGQLEYRMMVDGRTVGYLMTYTQVDGTKYFDEYGKEVTSCKIDEIYFGNFVPFKCRVTGSDTVTVTDLR